MILTPGNQPQQGLAVLREATMLTSPCKVATPYLIAILCTFILHYTESLLIIKAPGYHSVLFLLSYLFMA